jgi:Uma2 family endonuclease
MADLAATAESELARIERLWYELEAPDGARVELIDGQIVVSPTASIPHSSAVSALIYQLVDVARARNWEMHTLLTAHVAATRERLVPDLMIAPKSAREFSEWELVSAVVLFVAEVVSPSSRRRDRETKHRAYAQGEVPLYLLIDHFAQPPAVTLFSRPGRDGYQEAQTAQAGQPLLPPEPFGVRLDTARLLG